MTTARIHSRHRDSLCAICLRLTCSGLTPLSVAERLCPPHTTARLMTNEPSQFLSDTFSIAPTRCQRIDRPIGRKDRPLSKHLQRGIRDEPVWNKMRRRDAIGRRRTYTIPLAFASAATRSTSARRSESFLAIQVSQDFPVAVSSPVKAIAAIWS